MSIAQHLQNAWQRQAKWLIVLRPLSCLYRFVFLLNKHSYQLGLKKSYLAPVPVMVIGNITVGGSGKTPLLIQLVKYLQSKQLRVAVISRGYGGRGPFPVLVESDSLPEIAGDEPCQIVQATGVPMAVGPNRQANIELLLQHGAYDLIISDDGLQHWALQRQLEWIVLDNQRGLGNQKLLPEGYLREPASRLKHSTVIEHALAPTQVLNMHLAVAAPYLLQTDPDQSAEFDSTQTYCALVGIGFPQRFYQTLQQMGVSQFQPHEFPDHHEYVLEDLDFAAALPIITTEKDAVKLKALLQHSPDFKRPIWVVPVTAVLSDACYELLDQQLQQLGVVIA